MDNFPPDHFLDVHLGCVGVFAQDREDEVQHFFQHTGELRAFVHLVDSRAIEKVLQPISIDDGDDDCIEGQTRLDEIDVLVAAQQRR